MIMSKQEKADILQDMMRNPYAEEDRLQKLFPLAATRGFYPAHDAAGDDNWYAEDADEYVAESKLIGPPAKYWPYFFSGRAESRELAAKYPGVLA